MVRDPVDNVFSHYRKFDASRKTAEGQTDNNHCKNRIKTKMDKYRSSSPLSTNFRIPFVRPFKASYETSEAGRFFRQQPNLFSVSTIFQTTPKGVTTIRCGRITKGSLSIVGHLDNANIAGKIALYLKRCTVPESEWKSSLNFSRFFQAVSPNGRK